MKYARQQWDRVAAVVLALIAALLLLIGWLGVRDTAYPAEQIPYIVSGGLGALLLVGISAVLWISADLRDEWRKIDSLEEAVREQLRSGMSAAETPGNGVADGSAGRRSRRTLAAADPKR